MTCNPEKKEQKYKYKYKKFFSQIFYFYSTKSVDIATISLLSSWIVVT